MAMGITLGIDLILCLIFFAPCCVPRQVKVINDEIRKLCESNQKRESEWELAMKRGENEKSRFLTNEAK
jgi:hypothetical protein